MGRNWQPQVSKCLFLSSEESKGFQVSRGRRYLSPQNQVQWEASTSLHYGTYLEQNENKKNRRLINWKFSEIGKALQYPVSIFLCLCYFFWVSCFFFEGVYHVFFAQESFFLSNFRNIGTRWSDFLKTCRFNWITETFWTPEGAYNDITVNGTSHPSLPLKSKYIDLARLKAELAFFCSARLKGTTHCPGQD